MSHVTKAPPMSHAGQGFTRLRWCICALLFLATTINSIDQQILALLKPTLDQELGWPYE
jgi:MFS transporter, ACS family, hexuronate transporter